MKTHTYALALILCSSSAAALDCTQPANDMQAQICADPALSDLAALADDVGNAVGQTIQYETLDAPNDLRRSFNQLVRTLTLQDIDRLQSTHQGLAFDFNTDNKLLFIKAPDSPLYDMIVMFGSDDTVTYVHYNDSELSYRLNDDILEIEYFIPNPSYVDTRKYRYQDDCWRRIGEDLFIVGENPYKYSFNHLTGQAVFDYIDGTSVTRTFDPHIICIEDKFSVHQLTYHDSE